MNNKTLLYVGIGIVVGAAALYFYNWHKRQQTTQPTPATNVGNQAGNGGLIQDIAQDAWDAVFGKS